MKDYRPFAEGSHLLWKMNDGIEGKSENTFILKNLRTGRNETYTEDEYMNKERLWDETRNWYF